MTVRVAARAGSQSLAAQEVKLEAEGAAELAWTAQAPEGTRAASPGSSKPAKTGTETRTASSSRNASNPPCP